MNFRAEVINGNCANKSDFVIIYNTLQKLETKWANNHYLMVKCSKMLAKISANGIVPDLKDICHWIGQHVGVVVDTYEVRNLLRYVSIIMNDHNSRAQGYCDLHPPPTRHFNVWCEYISSLAAQNLQTAKEHQSLAFKQQLEKLAMMATAAVLKKVSKTKSKKKMERKISVVGVRGGSGRSGQLPNIVGEMFPSATGKCCDGAPLARQGAGSSKTKLMMPGQLSPLKEGGSSSVPYNKLNSAHPGFDNLAAAVVQAQVDRHLAKNKKYLLTTKFPELSNAGGIDYCVMPVSRSLDSLEKLGTSSQKSPVVKKLSFNDQVDDEVFGAARRGGGRRFVDQHGLVQDTGVSQMVRERHKFRLESQRLKDEVFATLGL